MIVECENIPLGDCFIHPQSLWPSRSDQEESEARKIEQSSSGNDDDNDTLSFGEECG